MSAPLDWLRHAFAVRTADGEPTAAQLAIVERLAGEVVRRRLTPAAIAFLEMSRPLNYLGAQSLHFFAPLISAIVRSDEHEHLATFLERRDAIDRLCGRIEWLERAHAAAQPPAGPSVNK